MNRFALPGLAVLAAALVCPRARAQSASDIRNLKLRDWEPRSMLVTKKTDAERLDRFYALVKTPARPGETVEHPCTLPAGTVPADRPMWLTAFGLEIPAPSRTSIAGFTAGWVLVGVLIGAFILFVRG